MLYITRRAVRPDATIRFLSTRVHIHCTHSTVYDPFASFARARAALERGIKRRATATPVILDTKYHHSFIRPRRRPVEQCPRLSRRNAQPPFGPRSTLASMPLPCRELRLPKCWSRVGRVASTACSAMLCRGIFDEASGVNWAVPLHAFGGGCLIEQV
jgi:hypothetical protein